MLPTTAPETKHQLRKGPAVCAIRICLDGCKPAYLGAAIGPGLVPNWDRTLQNGTNHIAHFVIPSYTNSNPNKSDMNCGVLTRNKTNMACCLRGNVVQMRNESREILTTAYRT